MIPARRRGVPNGEIRNLMYRKFPRKLYGPRAKIETVFSVIKRKLSAKAPGRTLPMQVRQALLLGLAFNLYRLKHRQTLRGCQQSFLTPLFATLPKLPPANPIIATLTHSLPLLAVAGRHSPLFCAPIFHITFPFPLRPLRYACRDTLWRELTNEH